jgi:hypothetical protein
MMMGPAQFLAGQVTFLTLPPSWHTFNFEVVSYPFNIGNLNTAPQENFGVFPTAIPSMIWNLGNVNNNVIWTIDPLDNLNQIAPSDQFELKFVGSNTTGVKSNYVIIEAQGGYNSSAVAYFSLVLPQPTPPGPTPDDGGSNVVLIVILSILGVGLIVGGFFLFKKWKASKVGDNYTGLKNEKKIEE